MQARKPLAALLSILLLAMSSWAAACNASYASERPCPCCPKTRLASTERLNADRVRVKTPVGLAFTQYMEQLALQIESVPIWSNSPAQCDHQASGQIEFLAPVRRGINRSQVADGPFTRTAYAEISPIFGHSPGMGQEVAALKNTAVDPLSLSLRI